MLQSIKKGAPAPCLPAPSHSCPDWPAAQVTGGRNGYGAKLANIFSSEFTIETCDGTRKRQYRQVNHQPYTASLKTGQACSTCHDSMWICALPGLTKANL